jgi:hypothetical protein
MKFITRREVLSNILALGLFVPLFAYGEGKQKGSLFTKKKIVLDVVLYSYLNRPIFDIYLNGIDLGVANSYGGTGVITGVAIPFGMQTLTWRLGGPRGLEHNGDMRTAKNSLSLTSDQIPESTRYLGVHIYPDNTVELTCAEHMPKTTARGHRIIEEGKRRDK